MSELFSELFIDSATCTQLLQYYTSPESLNEWDEKCARNLTLSLLTPDPVSMAPGPGRSGSAAYLYGHLMKQLTSFVAVRPSPSEEVTDWGNDETLKWCLTNQSAISTALAGMKDDASYGKWIDWTVHHMFEEHARRLGGLFNREHASIIARLWNTTDDEVTVLQESTASEKYFRQIASGKARQAPEWDGVVEAFLISSLVRSIFHDKLAHRQKAQVLHHPYRYFILPSLWQQSANHTSELRNDVACLLADEVLKCAWVEKSPEGRIQLWAENVQRVRSLYKDRSNPFPDFAIREDAEKCAESTAKGLGLRNYSRTERRWMDNAWNATLNIAALAGSTVLTPTIIEHWPSLSVNTVDVALGLSGIAAVQTVNHLMTEEGGAPSGLAVKIGGVLRRLSLLPGGRVNPVSKKPDPAV